MMARLAREGVCKAAHEGQPKEGRLSRSVTSTFLSLLCGPAHTYTRLPTQALEVEPMKRLAPSVRRLSQPSAVGLALLWCATIALVSTQGLSASQGQPAVGQKAVQQPAADSVADLASDTIVALGRAGAARDALSRIKLTGNPLADGLASMTATRHAISRILEGRAQLSQYRMSATPAIKLTADAFDDAFGALEAAWRRSISLDERVLRARTREDLAGLVSEASKVASDADEAWRMLPLGVAALAHSLVDNNRKVGGNVGYIQITSAQRAALIASTKSTLPKSLRSGNQHAVDASARMFREFLSNGWKTSDER
jgi:hypothetical protein